MRGCSLGDRKCQLGDFAQVPYLKFRFMELPWVARVFEEVSLTKILDDLYWVAERNVAKCCLFPRIVAENGRICALILTGGRNCA